MKRISKFFGFILIVCLFFNSISGQFAERKRWLPKTKIGVIGSGNLFVAPLADNHVGGNLGLGMGAFIDYKLNPNWKLNLSLNFHQVNIDYTPELKNSIIYAGLHGKYIFRPYKDVRPFLKAGLGPFSFTQENGLPDRYYDGMLSLGVGTEFALSKKIDIIPAVNYNIPNSGDIDGSSGLDTYLNFEIGLSFALGEKKHKKEPEKVKESVKKARKPEKEEEKIEKKTKEEAEEKTKEAEKKAEEVKEKVEEKVEKIEEKPEEKIEEEKPQFYEKLQYMIQPNDYLVKIANKMYDDRSKWRDIWNWNRDKIGDNPNLIYPYHELGLKNVPVQKTSKLEFEFYNYEVGPNETLWSIAKKEYNDPYAWIVIYRDNKDTIERNRGKVKPGMILKIRNKLLNK